ncbi:ribulose 1,5-bisphosphate synthetase/thiazole synthase [Pullulanibacillus pueri]|uniref:FAD dependent oxidoreductase n=1 Tax=Pullulanibacillus pueri TaxID=1437324 RepID=A0A8J3EKJ5_9BACL|nr:FAD-dependent oxidoreductase [Pullulanibacillus pueri]MBM7679900.1 ribulose 1,5-bisphosphate synthetase/thiazole synthase [Pullulanibacillus pueri]GGH73394.1 hypothetical protein GCM10007096_00580 [Pullulanibacillus pueri]
MTTCYLPAQKLPIISDVDFVIIGGSFAGISTALELANQGKKVMVVESRTYLGSELTATLSPWITLPLKVHPPLIQACIEASGQKVECAESEMVTFHMDQLKLGLEDALQAAGISLLYASLPVGITSLDDNRTGLIIANKSGRQLIRCNGVADATETAITTFLTKTPLTSTVNKGQSYYKRVLEFNKVEDLEQTTLAIPAELGLLGNSVRIFPGVHGDGHLYVEYQMEFNAENSLEENRKREIEAQKKGMALAAYLSQQVPAFRKALLCLSSYELKGPFHKTKAKPNTALQLEALRCKFPHVWCFYKDFYENGNEGWLDAVQAAAYGEQFARLLSDSADEEQEHHETHRRVSQGPEPYTVKIPTDFIEGNFIFKDVEEQAISYSKSTQVLVAGGGSSGGPAAIVSAQEGMQTVLVDLNPGLGGTGTFGGVDSYWFGKRHGFAKKIMDRVQAVQQSIGYKGPKWNIEAKKYALLETANQLDIAMYFNTITFGAITKGSRVCGSVVATRWGVCAIFSDCVLDATGDGDLAAFAEANFNYGAARDHVVMWYSLSQYKLPGKLQNNFTSMVNVADIRDYTRAILAGRRRGQPGRRSWRLNKESCHDHGIYVAPRESRHIVGDVTMTMEDQLLHRQWPDTINIHFSNHDMKGISEAHWLYTGFIPPNLDIEIPYRMLLPKGLDGLLVVGKAISATHDALPAIRMQSDLENLGGIAALAASMAIKEKKEPREIDYRRLQEKLVDKGLLPQHILNRDLKPTLYSDEELAALVNAIEVDQPLYEYSNMPMDEVYHKRMPFVEICTAGRRIIPYLEKAHENAEGIRKVRLAQALAMYRSKAGVSTLIAEITSMLRGDQLPKRTADILYVTLPPDHGAMPDVCYLIYSLGLTRDKRSLAIWQRVVELLHPSEEDFKDPMWGIFYYVHAVCLGAEQLGHEDAIPILRQLRRIPFLHQQHCQEGYQADYFLERRALLELAIGRALARCGSSEGYDILINYLGDARSLLSKQAHTVLKRLSGLTIGHDKRAWLEWLKEAKARLIPQPYLGPEIE